MSDYFTTGCGEVPAGRDESRQVPAWHDRPTGPGLWFVKWTRYGTGTATIDQYDIDSHRYDGMIVRCFGPIPPDATVKQS